MSTHSDGAHSHAGHSHGHSHAVVGPDTDARRLKIGLALLVAFMVGEIVAGILADSLALLSDAAHMLTDAGALLLALIVLRLVRRPATGNLTFGLRRTEILSAQANGATLLVLGGLIGFGAIPAPVGPPAARRGRVPVRALGRVVRDPLGEPQVGKPTPARLTTRARSSTSSPTSLRSRSPRSPAS